MGKNDFDGKQSEKDEKELQKQEEKSAEEKFQRDPLGSVVWALILIWAGFVLLAGNTGMLDTANQILDQILVQMAKSIPFEISAPTLSAWSLIFIGAGILLLAEVVVRLLFPSYRRPILGTAIFAVILLGIGIGSWSLLWPFILIIVGLALL
ncbi:MAG: hypothetical protein R3293_29190, partial [Candidatus Promineifilaceae bacterium]|nr:hypothetical protein [Candidatus Promineifilaceae bacterium]